jgi:Ni,Fe-hydrogenase maturation factor
MSASSHTLPLPVLGNFLAEELGCQVEYLGIQAGQLEFDSTLSPEIQRAVEEIIMEVKKQFRNKTE